MRQPAGTAILVALLAGAPQSGGAAADTVTLATPIAYGSHLPGLGKPALELARTLEEASEGALRLDLKQPGEGTLPHEILDKVSDGNVDAGFATAGFWAAKLPAAPLFGGFPFGPDARGYLAWFDRGHGRTLYQEMYDQAKLNVRVIPCGFGGAETGGWFAKEVTSKADLEGLRMRIFGLGARVVSRVGAVPVLVPTSGITKAFKTKQIGAAEVYTPAVDRALGLRALAPFIYLPGWHQPATVLELLVNKDRWNGLSADRRTLIEDTCRQQLQAMAARSAGLQAAALATWTDQDGVRVMQFPTAVLDALQRAWQEIATEEGVRDYFFKEVLEDWRRFAGADDAAPEPPPQTVPQAVPQAAAPAAAEPDSAAP
jgi:TRAP-type mannitol/chloroaromatic compound transport system substrate-binding protein